MDIEAFLQEQMAQAQGGGGPSAAGGFDQGFEQASAVFDQGAGGGGFDQVAVGGFDQGAGMDADVQRFIDGHAIQQNAMDTFLSLMPHQQRLVMDAGSLTDARDPTAVLISRCVKAKQGTLQAVQYRPGDWKCTACGEINFARNDTCRKCNTSRDVAASPLDGQSADAMAVINNYLAQYTFEERAKETFRSLPPHLMQQVMDAGSFADARDPTAVLVSRINKAKQGTLGQQNMLPGDWLCPSCGHHNFCKNTTCRSCGAPNTGGGGGGASFGSAGMSMSIPQILPGGKGGKGGKGTQKRFADQQFGFAPQAKARRTDVGGGGDIIAKIQQFFLQMGIQQHAIDQFFTLPPEAQTSVMEGGPLENARDPTGVLISRISKARNGQSIGQSFGQFNQMQTPRQMPQGYSSLGTGMDPETWLSQYTVEAHAADTFRGLAPNLQQLIMDAGSLADAREPTAVLVSRINKARSGTLQPLMTSPGDWNCPQCGDHNFSRNTNCRKCGFANPSSAGMK